MLPIAAVVISYRRPPMVLSCLGKLLALPDAPAKVWLVDNAPDDGTAALVRVQYPAVEVIDAGGNRGFAAGNNLGMRAALDAGYQFILLLNDDAELKADSLTVLYAAMEADDTIGSSGPLVYYGDESNIWSAGGRINRRTGMVRHVICPPAGTAVNQVDYVVACAVLYRGAALERVGLFDVRFFMYYEDSDLGMRLADAGYRNVIAGNAIALHHVPRDLAVRMKSPVFSYYLQRNRLLFVRKYNPLAANIGGLIWRGVLEQAIVLGRGNWAGFRAGLKGLYHGILGKGGRMEEVR